MAVNGIAHIFPTASNFERSRERADIGELNGFFRVRAVAKIVRAPCEDQ